jgi:hypothetical protein
VFCFRVNAFFDLSTAKRELSAGPSMLRLLGANSGRRAVSLEEENHAARNKIKPTADFAA